MRTLLLGSVLALPGAASAQDPAPAPVPPEVTFRGEVTGVTTWTGRVRITGDIEVPDKAALVIKAGTEVIIDGSDASHAGWNPGLIEIHVKGRLRIEGELLAPVSIGPADMATTATTLVQTRQPARWHGIVLHPRTQRAEDRNTIRGAVFAHAFAGVQVPDESPLLEDSVFLQCDVGVEAGSAYKSRTEVGLPGRQGCPEITRCRFAQCITGIYAEGNARPDVYRSVFYRCGNAVGNRRPGITYTLHPPGVSVVHCALLHNNIAAAGSVLTRDSIFAGTASRYGGEACEILEPLGWQVAVEAESGSFTEFGGRVLDARLDEGWDAAVVLLGTNYGGDEAGYEADLADILDRLAPRPTLVLTTTDFREMQSEVNAVIARQVLARENVDALDWTTISSQAGVLSGDGIHPTDAGRQLLVEGISLMLGQAPVRPGDCLTSEFTDDSAVAGAPGGSGGMTTVPNSRA